MIAIALAMSVSCYAAQTDMKPERYVHHEYIDGTARIDYVEMVNGDNMLTHYYKYEKPANPFLVTKV